MGGFVVRFDTLTFFLLSQQSFLLFRLISYLSGFALLVFTYWPPSPTVCVALSGCLCSGLQGLACTGYFTLRLAGF